jgi:hypothetical protein
MNLKQSYFAALKAGNKDKALQILTQMMHSSQQIQSKHGDRKDQPLGRKAVMVVRV